MSSFLRKSLLKNYPAASPRKFSETSFSSATPIIWGDNIHILDPAVDDLLKHRDDMPTIGIILCKYKKQKIVKYSLRDTNKPIGVSSYSRLQICEVQKEIMKLLWGGHLARPCVPHQDEMCCIN